jgi:heme oxygenase
MATFYERLEKDTSPARRRFMEIPIVAALLGGGAGAENPDPAAAEYMRGIYIRFLQESYYYVREASPVYALAGSRMSEADDEVRQWLLHHAVEEHGHHKWIEDDLRALKSDPALLATSKPSVWCDALIAVTYYVAGHGNPMGLLGDTYVIEGLSQLFASQLAGTMKGAMAIPDNAVSYLAKHGEADQGHMDEFRDMVNQSVRREQDYQDILQVAKTEFALYGALVENLGP